MSGNKGLLEAKKIAERSGNNFHCKVLRHLMTRGWTTLISPYYVDGVTNRPREIDIIAEKSFEFSGNRFAGQKEFIANIRLFIECKYVKTKSTIFWFDKRDIQKAERLVYRRMYGKEGNMYTRYHHYLESNVHVAKLFNTDSSNDGGDGDPVFKALNQCINGMINARHGHLINKTPQFTFVFPVIVWNSFETFYRKNVEDDSDPEHQDGNFLLEVNYAYYDQRRERSNNEYFLIDMVDFNQFDDYLKMLASNLENYKEMLYPELPSLPYEDET